MSRRIEACIVNHNSSAFCELALRSLVANHADLLSTGQLRITVMDNHSADDDLAGLIAACTDLDAAHELSTWPLADTNVNSHGDVMRRFVAENPMATHYLFIDADTYCLSEATVDRMAAELDAVPDAWAVQARFSWIEEHEARLTGRGEDVALHHPSGWDATLFTAGDGQSITTGRETTGPPFTAQSQQWFETVWATIAHDYTI